MASQIALILLVAVAGSLSVPVMMAVLARLGYFEPLEFVAFGRHWRICPPVRPVKTVAASGGAWAFPQSAVATATMPVMAFVVHVHTAAIGDAVAQAATITGGIATLVDIES